MLSRGRPLSTGVCLLLKLMIWPWEAPADRVREGAQCKASWWLTLVLSCCRLSIITNHRADTDAHTNELVQRAGNHNADDQRKLGGHWGCIPGQAHIAVSPVARWWGSSQLRDDTPVWPWLMGRRLHPSPFTQSAGLWSVCSLLGQQLS